MAEKETRFTTITCDRCEESLEVEFCATEKPWRMGWERIRIWLMTWRRLVFEKKQGAKHLCPKCCKAFDVWMKMVKGDD